MSADDDEHQRLAMAARLREAREYLGFSQDEVAVSLGVSRPAISNIEAGGRKVEALELQKLANLYGRSVSFLLTGAEEQKVEAEKVAFAARALKGLSGKDLEEVARFADYLRNAGRTGTRKGK